MSILPSDLTKKIKWLVLPFLPTFEVNKCLGRLTNSFPLLWYTNEYQSKPFAKSWSKLITHCVWNNASFETIWKVMLLAKMKLLLIEGRKGKTYFGLSQKHFSSLSDFNAKMIAIAGKVTHSSQIRKEVIPSHSESGDELL